MLVQSSITFQSSIRGVWSGYIGSLFSAIRVYYLNFMGVTSSIPRVSLSNSRGGVDPACFSRGGGAKNDLQECLQ